MVLPSGDGSQACRLVFATRVEECASDEMKHHAFLEGSRVSMGISERMGDVLGLAVESKLMREIAEHPVSVKHLAIIMDGNRRFAWKSNVATGIGHRIGKEVNHPVQVLFSAILCRRGGPR